MTLVIYPPEGPELEVRTHRAELHVGYNDDCDIVIEDPTLDELHCILTRLSTGAVRLEDNNSYNGTFVNRIRVPGHTAVGDGHEIRLGNTRIKLWTNAALTDAQEGFDGLPQCSDYER